MPEPLTAVTAKPRTRKARRNYEQELRVLKLQCEVSLEVLEELRAADPDDLFLKGQIAFAKSMKARFQ